MNLVYLQNCSHKKCISNTKHILFDSRLVKIQMKIITYINLGNFWKLL